MQYMDNNNHEQAHQPIKKNTKFVKWALILGIVIVLNLFFNYTIHLLYKEPKFERFCPVELTSKAYTTKEMCVTAGGQWNETTNPITPPEIKGQTAPVPATLQISGYCDVTYTCNTTYQTATSVYNRNVFIILVILGVASLVLGVMFASISVVSTGLSFGGVISLIIGSMRYWSDMNDIVRVLVLAFALAALIWIGVKKIRE